MSNLRFAASKVFSGKSPKRAPRNTGDPSRSDGLPPFEKGGQGGFAASNLPGRLLLALVLACLHAPLFAQVATNAAPLQFRDAAEERRFHALASELRCVMCQNQSLADSNARIAHDLRAEVLDLMRQGRSDAEIKRFLVQRYGEFVLYRPRVEAGTWLLWFGPLLLLAVGGFAVARIVRRRSRSTPPADDAQEW